MISIWTEILRMYIIYHCLLYNCMFGHLRLENKSGISCKIKLLSRFRFRKLLIFPQCISYGWHVVYTVQWLPCLLSISGCIIKKTATSRITLGVPTYTSQMLWRDCANNNSVRVTMYIIFHENQISHLAFEALMLKWHKADGLRLRKICNNKGAGQPAHPRSLIRNFVICFLKESYLDALRAKL